MCLEELNESLLIILRSQWPKIGSRPSVLAGESFPGDFRVWVWGLRWSSCGGHAGRGNSASDCDRP